jgi:hypothetical protein
MGTTREDHKDRLGLVFRRLGRNVQGYCERDEKCVLSYHSLMR